MSSPNLNFYLTGFSTTVNLNTPATFFPVVDTVNFSDYSANVICRMKLSAAQHMFQFWSKSADLSSNSLSDLVFRTMYDPSAGFNIVDASATPLSLDFTRGSIITYSDPSNINLNSFTISGSQYQALFPQGYLRYLSWLIFNNPNLTTNFINASAVMSSVDTQSKLALNNTLKNITAYVYDGNTGNNRQKQFNFDNYYVDPNTFNVSGSKLPNYNSNPSAQIFQQIRTNARSRIETMSVATSKIVDASNSTHPNGAWYKMPFQTGDSIYFILTVNTPTGQVGSDGSTVIAQNSRNYRFRMYIMDDSVINTQTIDSNSNPINFGGFNIYPTANSLVANGYSYADPSPNTIDPNDTKTPGP